MKRMLVSSLAVVMAMVGTSQVVNAQSLTGGFKANANLSNFILTDMDNYENPMRVGASVGGFLKWDLSEHFAIQPELMFHYKASKLKNKSASIDSAYEYYGVEIPIYAVGQWDICNGRGYVGVGPYVGYGFSAKNYPGGNLYKNDARQEWDFGAGLLLGYEFQNRMSINAGYQIGFIDALDKGSDDATMLPQTVSLGLGYRF